MAYPLVADIKHEICKAYDVEAEDGVAYRGSFLIDRAGIVRHQVVNDLPLGRNIDEMLRMLDALHYATAVQSGCRFMLTNDRDFKTGGLLEVVGITSLLG